MPSDPEDFTTLYAHLSEPDLLDLARAYDTLTDPAQAALRAEFNCRHLDPPLADEAPDAVPTERTLTTIRHYRDLSEAIVARSFLESAGIVVYLRDENLVRLDWQVSNFIGGIRLQVEAGDASAALDLLTQPVPDTIAFGGPADFAQPHCPVCNSVEITFQGSSRGAALTSLYLLALPLPPGPQTWQCSNCGARWEDTSTPNSDPSQPFS
jgi:hypothetical protein